MPELPEVETVRRTIAPRLSGKRVQEVEILFPGVVEGAAPEAFAERVMGRRFGPGERHGKYLLFGLDSGEWLVVHLRMTGRLFVGDWEAPRDPYARLRIWLDGDEALTFADVRKFGRVSLSAGRRALSSRASLGPDALEELDEATLEKILQSSQARVKSLLLDQRRLAGLGNIYTDEALHAAGIDPRRPASSLSKDEAKRLFAAVRETLLAGIRHGGTSIRDFVNGEGIQGRHQDYLNVYGREGRPCRRCGGAVMKERIAGRGTHFCPRCQQ